MIRKIVFAVSVFVLGAFFVCRTPWSASNSLGVTSAHAQMWAEDASADESDSEAVDSEPARLKGSPPPPPSIAGHWSGSIHDEKNGDGVLHLTISQEKRRLRGDWDSAFEPGGGRIRGHVERDDDGVTIQLREGPRCRASAHGTLVSPTHITATYTLKGCHEKDSGTFDITKDGQGCGSSTGLVC